MNYWEKTQYELIQPGQIWYDENQKRHRDNDLPAMITAKGSQFWYQHGEIHRDGDKPAIIWWDGAEFWFQHGQLHRDNLPACIFPNGNQFWYQHDNLIKQIGTQNELLDGFRL